MDKNYSKPTVFDEQLMNKAYSEPIPFAGTAILNEGYTPTDPKRIISIEPLDVGYIVRVGCQTVAVESKETLIKNLTAYITDPIEYEKNYNKTKKYI